VPSFGSVEKTRADVLHVQQSRSLREIPRCANRNSNTHLPQLTVVDRRQRYQMIA
jgi:hypothetical protein